MNLLVAGRSDPGLVRESNEDGFLLLDARARKVLDPGAMTILRDGAPACLLAVADGMGGAAAGEVASRVALQAVTGFACEYFDEGRTRDPRFEFSGWLAGALDAADRAVEDEARRVQTQNGMGTTLTIVGLLAHRIAVAHVGDSRAYLLRRDRLRRLTTDDTYVQTLVARGDISEQEARAHPRRHQLMHALGIGSRPDVQVLRAAVRDGDRLLLCSDGVHDFVDDATIRRHLADGSPPPAQCNRIVESAKEAGGRDNITAVIAFLEPEEHPAEDGPLGAQS